MDLKVNINQSLARATRFLTETVAVPEQGFGIKRCSSFHHVEDYPDMCLPATYNATHALILTGGYRDLAPEQRASLVDFINRFQIPGGQYRCPQMKDNEIWKGKDIGFSRNYIDFHITNYSMGAVRSLGFSPAYPLEFIDPYLEPEQLKQWLKERDLSDPWLEGNSIVNMGSFLMERLQGQDDARLKELLEVMIQWHNQYQDPATGFWGTDLPGCPASVMEGMAGAAHDFHLYYYLNREMPYFEKVVDYCLEFVQGQVKSACLDIDVVDILANLVVYGYRKDEILSRLAEFSEKLIAFQNEDGGFADEKRNTLVRRMDGWVKGYFEPQGLSNCFATWFRCATLAMAGCVLFPETKDQYTFRNSIGIGYFNKEYLPEK